MPPASRGSRRDFAALEARRYEAARLFTRGESQVTVARTLGVTRAAAHRWYHAWQDAGRTALKAAGRAGRKSRLEAPQLARVEAGSPTCYSAVSRRSLSDARASAAANQMG
jgi:transposase